MTKLKEIEKRLSEAREASYSASYSAYWSAARSTTGSVTYSAYWSATERKNQVEIIKEILNGK